MSESTQGNAMRIVRYHSLQVTPWKNGGGVTREITRFPADSRLDDFEWRISTAIISEDGAFSKFEGIDRRLYLLKGDGLEIIIDGGEPKSLKTGEHIDFPGEVPLDSRLLHGPVVDLNIMLRRDRYAAHFEEVEFAGTANMLFPWKTAVLFLRSGQLRVLPDLQMAEFDTLIFDPDHGRTCTMKGRAEAILIGIDQNR